MGYKAVEIVDVAALAVVVAVVAVVAAAVAAAAGFVDIAFPVAIAVHHVPCPKSSNSVDDPSWEVVGGFHGRWADQAGEVVKSSC